jgi:hypothetical protein
MKFLSKYIPKISNQYCKHCNKFDNIPQIEKFSFTDSIIFGLLLGLALWKALDIFVYLLIFDG